MVALGFGGLFLILFVGLAFVNLDYAYYLPASYISHYNVSVTGASNLVIGTNTNSTATLTVIPTSAYSNYWNGHRVSTIYNATIRGSNLTALTLNQGAYTVILKAPSVPINYTFDVVTLPLGEGNFITLNGKYTYNLNLSNYSSVHVLLISPKNIDIKASTYSNYTMDAYYYNNEYNSSFSFDAGRQSLTFTTKQPDKIFFFVNVTPTLANPLNFLNATKSYSTGVASYGLYNITNVLIPYEIRTNQIEGYANITAMSAYNALPPQNVSRYGASLQLNVMLKIKSTEGKTYAYWLQDVMQFNTSKNNYSIEDNIWNATGSDSKLANSTLSGRGYVTAYYDSQRKSDLTYYAASALITPYSYYQHYTFPLYFSPIIKVEIKNGLPIAKFGYSTKNGPHFYDNVTIDLQTSDAYLLTTPYYRVPANATGGTSQFYDTELVFGGESTGALTNFNKFNAKLWIFYFDGNGTAKAFPSAYTVGYDTEEAATNLSVSGGPKGLALISTGKNNNTINIVLQAPAVTTISTTIPPTTTATTLTVTSLTTIIEQSSQGAGAGTETVYTVIGVAIILGGVYTAYRILKFIVGQFRSRAPQAVINKKLDKRKQKV